jgi:hypothetical protein
MMWTGDQARGALWGAIDFGNVRQPEATRSASRRFGEPVDERRATPLGHASVSSSARRPKRQHGGLLHGQPAAFVRLLDPSLVAQALARRREPALEPVVNDWVRVVIHRGSRTAQDGSRDVARTRSGSGDHAAKAREPLVRVRPYEGGASGAVDAQDRRAPAVLLLAEPDPVDVKLGHAATRIARDARVPEAGINRDG